MNLRKLALSQLDQMLDRFRVVINEPTPQSGWIRPIRDALGMTRQQLGKRLGVTHQAVTQAEQREAKGEITLKQLRKIAAALDCDLIYAMVPREPLERMVHDRARRIATGEIEKLDHSMALEDQQIDTRRREEQIEELAAQYLQRRSRLWR